MTVALSVSLCLHAAALVGWRLVVPVIPPQAGGDTGPEVLTVVTITADELSESDARDERVSPPPALPHAATSPPPTPVPEPAPTVEPVVVPSPPILEEPSMTARTPEPVPEAVQRTVSAVAQQTPPPDAFEPSDSEIRPPDREEGREAGGGSPSPSSNFVRAAPSYRVNRPPRYPVTARRRGQEGLVLLSVVVSAQGTVIRVGIKQSSGFDLLDDAALRAVRKWQFEPARIGARSVECETEVPVQFKLVREQ